MREKKGEIHILSFFYFPLSNNLLDCDFAHNTHAHTNESFQRKVCTNKFKITKQQLTWSTHTQ